MSYSYRVKVPFQNDMGTVGLFVVTPTPMETASEQALWQINNMRDHDGLPHLSRMPAGTTYERD